MNDKRSSQEELVDIPLLEEESGDSGIVDGKECDIPVEVISNLSPSTTPVTPTKEETRLTTMLQVSLPFLFAGLGCVLAGLLLDVVEVRKYSCVYMIHYSYLNSIGG